VQCVACLVALKDGSGCVVGGVVFAAAWGLLEGGGERGGMLSSSSSLSLFG
jgi:hypothetical protein